MDLSVNIHPRGEILKRSWTGGFLPNLGNVWQWGIQPIPFLNEVSGEPECANAIEKGEMIMLGIPCLNVRHFNCSGKKL